MELLHPATWHDHDIACGMWLWNHDSEFTKWQHPAVWYVAMGWHAVEFAGGSTLQCGWWLWDDMPWNSPKRPPYWNSTSGFEFDHITAVDMSFCTSLRNFIKIGPPSAEKMTSYRFSRWRISAILDFMGPIMGSLKSPCMTSYRSSIDTIALNCLMFEKIAFLQFGDWHTNKQTNRWTASMHEASLALPSGGLITYIFLSRHRSSLQTDIDFVSLLLYIQIKCVGSKVCFFSLYA